MDREKVIGHLNDCLEASRRDNTWVFVRKDIVEDALAFLKEHEVENGEWITLWREDDPDTSTQARCSICNRISERPLGGYCKWCGAKMNQE